MASSPDTAPAAQVSGNVADLRWFVFALFFIFGGLTSLNDILIPKLKHLFALSHTEAMLVQTAFFIAYFLFSIPAAMVVKRFGYLRSASFGLLTMTAGCLLFIPASASGLFVTFLVALFVLGAGITMVQVVANPLISLLGPPATAHSRLTFAQAFNSLGTTIFPFVGARLILGSLADVDEASLDPARLIAYRAQESQVITNTYIGLAIALALVAAVVWTRRHKLTEAKTAAVGLFSGLDLLRRPRFAFGVACIFLYVGAEVAIGSLLVSWLTQPSTMGLSDLRAGELVTFYWGGAMVGRFIGSWALQRFSPGLILAAVTAGAILLLALAATATGPVAGVAILSIGLMNSIMFPTIFSLGCEGLGPRAADGSGLMSTAIVGGAIVPLLTGVTIDAVGLRTALIVPALCYAIICAFGLYARRPAAEVA
ncbi:sugar MFS transporter [Sphingomonas sp. 1P06PA]